MRSRYSAKAMGLVVMVSLALFSGCTSKKTTAPDDQPEKPALTAMQQYFPLNHGDSWIWEVVGTYCLTEEFVDGDSSLGEPYEDNNQNGVFDYGEAYEDLNSNGKHDGPDDTWESPIPYADRNGNGEYDPADGTWQADELFLDLDGNGVCETACTLSLHASVLYPHPQAGVVLRGRQFLGSYSNGEPGGIQAWVDQYSNDSLGLTWYGEGVLFETFGCRPLVLAEVDPQIGDSLVSPGCFWWYSTWVSVFQAVEDVTVPAGSFLDCYKFEFKASGWTGAMATNNGISYCWYAKDVGLVKREGPKEGEYWILKSARVGGSNYP